MRPQVALKLRAARPADDGAPERRPARDDEVDPPEDLRRARRVVWRVAEDDKRAVERVEHRRALVVGRRAIRRAVRLAEDAAVGNEP